MTQLCRTFKTIAGLSFRLHLLAFPSFGTSKEPVVKQKCFESFRQTFVLAGFDDIVTATRVKLG
jgi:hypothetical protein